MGNVVSQICGGSAAPPPKPSQGAQLNCAGYDWAPEPEAPQVVAKVEPEPVAAPPPPPEPEVPKRPAPTTPIVLDTLQGEWVNSMGAKIKVDGTVVHLNGLPMKMHPITLNDDGTVCSVGKLWQMNGWLEDERIEWKEAPSREVMQFARSVVWSKATAERMVEWTKHMEGLGYSGSSRDPLKRGIEGCAPGTCDAKASVQRDDVDKDRLELGELNDLIKQWRYDGMQKIKPGYVIPDYSNRGHTGLSVEHVHYLAQSFLSKGFIKRTGNKGHDIPVLVQEPVTSELGKKSISNWREKLEDEQGFPPKEHYEKLFARSELYTSLGNGHFNQALNLFANSSKGINAGEHYLIGTDENLREAIEVGLDAIVLKSGIPLRDRETISKFLNSKREYKWTVHEDGSVDIGNAVEDTSYCKQFEAMSKVLDAVELNCLVRAELGVTESARIGV